MQNQKNTAEEVAIAVSAFIKDQYGDDKNPQILEGMWLAMQMRQGPGEAVRVLNYCCSTR